METTWWRAQPFFIHSFSLLTDVSTLCWSRSAPAHRAVRCVKRKVSVDPRRPSVYSAESRPISLSINAQRGTTIVPTVRDQKTQPFTLSRSHNTCPPPNHFPLTLLLAGAFGRKKVREEQEVEDNSSGSEKTTAVTATLSFQHLSPAECGSRSAPSVRTWEREHPQPHRLASSSQT